jgi:hypothetical protein
VHQSSNPPEWLTDPDFVVFAGEQPLPPGAAEEHSLGETMGTIFARRSDAVRQDWDRRIGQVRSLLEQMPVDAGDYGLDEVTFALGFSAEGQIVFVAKGGITTTITVTFKRRNNPPQSPPVAAGNMPPGTAAGPKTAEA